MSCATVVAGAATAGAGCAPCAPCATTVPDEPAATPRATFGARPWASFDLLSISRPLFMDSSIYAQLLCIPPSRNIKYAASAANRQHR